MTTIINPILPGFNPDPSICRVKDDFYIATSTFQWFPGVQIWHSRNLKDWHLQTRPLDEPRLLQLEGVQSSAGIWAPCLSYHEGIWYLVYTVVKVWRGESFVDEGAFKDTPNYLTTAASIDGPWSDPVYLNSSGFDPSLFHEGAKSWLLNMEWSYRANPTHFTGILLQEYDRGQKRLQGPIHTIFTGSVIGCTEGPHLYKKDNWYYLMTAEGGTSYAHAVSLARSSSLTGPYDLHPQNPLLHSLADEDLRLISESRIERDRDNVYPKDFFSRPQRAGHASICALAGNEWALVHLSGRPLPESFFCTRGRETSIQRLVWNTDDWPYVVDSKGQYTQLAEPRVQFQWEAGREDSKHSQLRKTPFSFFEDFSGPALNPHFRYLRRNPQMDMALKNHCLHLHGRESLVSPFIHSYVAVSVPFVQYVAETELDFDPSGRQEMAGLLVHYDERNQYYLYISKEQGQRILGIIQFVAGRLLLPFDMALGPGRVKLRLLVDAERGRFSWSQQGAWNEIAHDLDMGQLSDERVWPEGFTGTFVGMACHDLTGRRRMAIFHSFRFQGD